MTDDSIEFTRRKILGSLGAIGAAGAAAGYGTTALFGDVESFERNTILAGSLDLKMDWEEHYSFPQVYDDFGDPTVEDGTALDVTRSDPADDPSLEADNYTGLPIPEEDSEGRDPVVWARNNDAPTDSDESSLELYFANTVIEAFPDDVNTDPEGTFTFLDSGDDGEELPNTSTPCNLLADVPEPGLGLYNEPSPDGPDGDDVGFQQPGRTLNDDTYDAENDTYEPLINLTDVKPGDFGEFTFSTHLCGNDGYLWLQMPGGLTENENTRVEPETGVDDTPDEGELAENVQTTLWYDDNCNNRIDGDVKPLVVLAVLDTSQSQEPVLQDVADAGAQLVTRLANDAEVPVFGGVITLDNTGDDRDAALQSLDEEDPITEIDKYVGKLDPTGDIVPGPGEVGGNSPLPHALDVAREYLNDVVDNGRFGVPQNAQKEILLLSDGAPSYGVGGGGSLAGPGRGALVDADSDSIVTDDSGDDIVSDYFDTLPNNEVVRYPDPNTTDGGTSRAETVLTARDIDGNEFIAGSDGTDQGPGPKVDNPDGQGDPTDPYGEDDADISGDNDITIRGIVSYPTSGDRAFNSSQQETAEDTMLAIATGDAFYNLGQNSAENVGNAVFMDQNVTGTAEEVIFQGTLKDLADELDPNEGGPLPLDHDRLTDGQSCFPAGSIHCFGLAWWVPTDVGNVIQSDSVSFDLGFYAEQCRNNGDPSGPGGESTPEPPTDGTTTSGDTA